MSTPRRRGQHSIAYATLVLVMAACSDSDEGLDPRLRVPDTGSYSYEAVVLTAEGEEPDTFVGTLNITVASEDSIIGVWDVPGYGSAAVRGIWNINSYRLPADPSPPIQGDITHAVWRQSSSDDLNCSLSYQLEVPADTFTSSAENHCVLEAN